MTNLNRQYNYLVNGIRVEIKKVYRTKTQFEYILNVFIGNSDLESILMYDTVFLTKKSALKHAKDAISNAKNPRIEKIYY